MFFTCGLCMFLLTQAQASLWLQKDNDSLGDCGQKYWQWNISFPFLFLLCHLHEVVPPLLFLADSNTSVGCNPSMCTVTQCHFLMNFLLVGQLSCISSTSIMSNSVKGHNRANFLFYKVNSDCHHSKSSYFNCHSFWFFPACLR